MAAWVSWLVLLPGSRKGPGSKLDWGLSMCSLLAFQALVWVFSRCSAFLPQSQTCTWGEMVILRTWSTASVSVYQSIRVNCVNICLTAKHLAIEKKTNNQCVYMIPFKSRPQPKWLNYKALTSLFLSLTILVILSMFSFIRIHPGVVDIFG